MVEYFLVLPYARSVASPATRAAVDPGPFHATRPSSLDHLRAVTRDVQLRLAGSLEASGHHGLRRGFAPFLERVRDAALPVGELAAELHVSPQAASRTARTLEELGYVTRKTSTTDGRSRLVTLTPRGRALLRRAHGTFASCEEAYARLIGRAALDRILADLEVLHFGLGLTPETDPAVPAPVPRSVGTCVLITLSVARRVRQSLAVAGHQDLRPSHQELLLVIGHHGGRVSDAARALRVSRQAVSAMAQDLEQLGYLERQSDVRDGRAVLVTPSDHGRSALEDMATAIREVEEQSRVVLGRARWTRLERDLAVLDAAITATDLLSEEGRPPDLSLVTATSSSDLARLAGWLRTRLGPADATRLGALLAVPPRHTRDRGGRSASGT